MMRCFTKVVLCFFAMLWVAFNTQVKAQNKKYTLSGQVFDSLTALPIKKASILVAGTSFSATTDSLGAYKIENLIPGTNNLKVWAPGYDTTLLRFEIRRNMKQNIKLLKRKDTTGVSTPKTDTASKTDSIITTTKPPATEKKPQNQGLTDKDKEDLRILIEDAIFSKSIFINKIKEKKKYITLTGSFSIDTGYLYEFEARFTRKPIGFELQWLRFEMKGRNMQ